MTVFSMDINHTHIASCHMFKMPWDRSGFK